MVCTIHGKYSHFCIGLAQSIDCAMMQLTRAVGHRHMHPTLTNTRLLNPPVERSVVDPVGPVTKKVVFLPMERTIGGGFLLSLRLALCYCPHLFQVRRHSPTLQCCAKLSVDHQTVADWSQFCRKTMSNFILICSLQLILMVVGGGSVAKLWK